ncbi:hypothetical protein [Actinacidiphila yanglinensis]|nr:hypothetical protein [Actinacidiphila yanglinensis]
MGRWTEEITAARIALRDACALDHPVAVVMSGYNPARALIETGRADEAREPLDLRVGHLDRQPHEARARTDRLAGRLCSRTDRNPEALQHARNAVAPAREPGRRGKWGRALTDAGWELAALGAYEEAVPGPRGGRAPGTAGNQLGRRTRTARPNHPPGAGT